MDKLMEGRTDGQTEGETDRPVERTDRLTDGWTDWQTYWSSGLHWRFAHFYWVFCKDLTSMLPTQVV